IGRQNRRADRPDACRLLLSLWRQGGGGRAGICGRRGLRLPGRRHDAAGRIVGKMSAHADSAAARVAEWPVPEAALCCGAGIGPAILVDAIELTCAATRAAAQMSAVLSAAIA